MHIYTYKFSDQIHLHSSQTIKMMKSGGASWLFVICIYLWISFCEGVLLNKTTVRLPRGKKVPAAKMRDFVKSCPGSTVYGIYTSI